jgi:hypothetical protein
MSVKKFVTGNFYDEAVLFPAVKKVRRAGYKIHDIFTPFPIHGLDKAMGLRDAACIQQDSSVITGTAGSKFITWALTIDWKLNFGGSHSSHYGLDHYV